MPDLLKYFRIEASEIATNLVEALATLRAGAAGGEAITRLHRYAHSLKGAGRLVKLEDLSDLGRQAEDAAAPFKDGQTPIPEATIGTLTALVVSICDRLRSDLEIETPVVARAEEVNR